MQDKTPLSLSLILGFTGGGFLFSGYLTFVKLLTGACAFNESCPIVFGHPACWYGFALYVALFSLAVLMFRKRLHVKSGMMAVSGVAFLGILFAGYLTIGEFSTLVAQGFGTYLLGLPTCAFGLIFFILTFVTAALALAHHHED